MVALLTLCASAAMEQNAAVQISIECSKHFITKCSVLWLKALFPTPLEFISVLVDKAVEHCLFRTSPSAGRKPLL